MADTKWNAIAELNLESVRGKFAFRKGWWWRLGNDPQRVEKEYRQFLYLIVTHPGETVVPWSRDVDDFWHEHILNTAKYAADCDAIMGCMIHHNPHLPEGTREHSKAFFATRAMYWDAFKARISEGRGKTSGGAGCGSDMPVVFTSADSAPGHHGLHGGHSSDGGHHGGGGHAHGCGGHGAGHGCGGHGGGHGCGGHGCGSGGH